MLRIKAVICDMQARDLAVQREGIAILFLFRSAERIFPSAPDTLHGKRRELHLIAPRESPCLNGIPGTAVSKLRFERRELVIGLFPEAPNVQGNFRRPDTGDGLSEVKARYKKCAEGRQEMVIDLIPLCWVHHVARMDRPPARHVPVTSPWSNSDCISPAFYKRSNHRPLPSTSARPSLHCCPRVPIFLYLHGIIPDFDHHNGSSKRRTPTKNPFPSLRKTKTSQPRPQKRSRLRLW
jgi:hypothetical protein